MFVYNPEVRKFLIRVILIFILSIFLSITVSAYLIDTVKKSVVENNQIIVGDILSKHPDLEDDIVDIITKGRNKINKNFGEDVLNKYNYSQNISLHNEPVMLMNTDKIYKTCVMLVLTIFLLFLIVTLKYFKDLYSDIKVMTEYVYNSSQGVSYQLNNKNQEGQVGVLKAELIKMTNILKENIELLQREKIFLNDTMSDISHQLRTPMTSLTILNDLMYSELERDVRIEFLDRIKSQLDRMDWLVKSMLKLSKVEANVIDFKKEKVNINELIHRAIQPMVININKKKQTLEIVGDKSASFIGDMNWSVEAIVNIIKNCVEHTNEEGVISIDFEENPLFSQIIISDTGEGIDDKDIPNIFKRFYRGTSSTKVESVGIGLAMSKSIINSQNGTIMAKSKKGIGSEFIIIINKYTVD